MARAHQLYEIHGVVVESEVPLEARPARLTREPIEPAFRIVAGDAHPVPMEAPPGRPLGEHRFGRFGYWSSEDRGGERWLFRFGEVCDAVIDRMSDVITLHPDPGADPGLVSITAGGGVLAHALVAKGSFLLHACAVELDGRAVAITGETGSGKSTVAALLCAEGARLMADDALLCEISEDGVICHPGNNVLRLRQGAAELARRIPGAKASTSVDGRVAVEPPFAEGPARLEAVLRPVPDHELEALEVDRLDGMDGLIELIRSPRPNAWTDADLIARLFVQTADAARLLPVTRVRVPWGPPFAPRLGRELLDAALGHSASGAAERERAPVPRF